MDVDAQIDDLEARLTTHLQYALFVNVNLGYWEELDELDNQSIQVLRDLVHDVLAPMCARYRGTKVADVLARFEVLARHALEAAMNVPFPRDPIHHVHAVLQNIMNIFVQTTYADLRTEMVMVNHWAHLIQRNWRHVITNPAFLVCRRRVEHEYAGLIADLRLMSNVLEPSWYRHFDFGAVAHRTDPAPA